MSMNQKTAMSLLKEKVRHSGFKLTTQREVICEVFFAQAGHRSAEEILQSARALDPNVSLATVYRTLKLLLEIGFAESHNFQDGQALYEPRFDTEHHDHLICTECSHIVEFVDEEIERLQARIASANGFTMTSHKMELYGLCANCSRNSHSITQK